MSRKLIPFQLKWAQLAMLEALKQQQRKGLPLRLIILKARRVGGSSFTEGLGLLQAIAEEATLGLIVAHLFKSSKGLFEVPTNLIDRALPKRESLQKLLGIAHTKHEIIVPRKNGDSTIQLATAGSVSGAGGRALSFTFLHLSEAAYFPGIQPFTSLLPTVPYDPNTIIVIESTANGRVGPGSSFYDYWQKACEGRNDFTPVFVPWWRDPTYLRPAESGQPPYDDYEEWLVKEFKCTPEQIAWWRATLETECKGVLQIMQQEYPASAEEAFVATGDPSFEAEELQYIRNMVCDPLAVGDIRCKPGELPVFNDMGTGDWCIWKFPVANHRYYIGADAARGLQLEEGDIEPISEGDFASVSVWDATTNEMVARYAKRDNPELLAHKLYGVGTFYNKAMISIELTGNLGVWAQKVLRDPPYSYTNLYRWRGSRDDRIGDSNRIYKRLVIGWETTMRTREMMFDAYRAAIRQGVLKVYDRSLLTQMENAQRKEGFRWEVVRGHDDILISALVGWIAREQWGPSWQTGVTSAGGTAPENVEGGSPSRSLGYQEGPAIIDGAAYTLANHYHKMKHLIAHGKQPNPLDGI
jgi:hypothetical protein